METTRSYNLDSPSWMHYNRASIERALTHHFGEGGENGWSRNDMGYCIPTSIGLVKTETLRETALVVWIAAEKARRIGGR